MAGMAGGLVVFIAIISAAAVVAMAAAVHRVYSVRGRPNDPETLDAMIAHVSNEQANYMRDVRMRGQLQAWGVAPAYEDGYMPPRSQVGRSGSVAGMTGTSFG